MTGILAGGAVIGAVLTILLLMGALSFFSDAKEVVSPDLYSFLKDIVGPIAAGFGGAIAGALTTYKVSTDAQAKTEGLIEARNYNRGVLILVSKLNELASIKKSMIIPCESDLLRFATIPALPTQDKDRGRAEAYLTETLIALESYDVIKHVVLAEEYFDSVRSSLNERNRMVDRHRAQIEQGDSRFEGRVSLNNLVQVHGVGATIKLYVFTEQFIEMVDDSIVILRRAIDSVSDTCAEKLKGRGIKILKYDFKKDNAAYNKTKSPHFKSPQHLRAVISASMHNNSLAQNNWKPSSYPYV
jgi:hypothetical protein